MKILISKSLFEELANLVHNEPVWAGYTLCGSTAQELVKRKLATQDINGYYRPTFAGKKLYYYEKIKRQVNLKKACGCSYSVDCFCAPSEDFYSKLINHWAYQLRNLIKKESKNNVKIKRDGE